MCFFAETSPAKTHPCDVILHAVRKRGGGLLREAFRGKDVWVVGWKRKGEKGKDQSHCNYKLSILMHFIFQGCTCGPQ